MIAKDAYQQCIKAYESGAYDKVVDSAKSLLLEPSTYYDVCLLLVKSYVQLGMFKEASELIDEELKMPYMPNEFEQAIKKEKAMMIEEEKQAQPLTIRVHSIEELEVYLDGSIDQQEYVLDYFSKIRLEPYLDLIYDYLLSDYGDLSLKTKLLYVLAYEQKGIVEVKKWGQFYDVDLNALKPLTSLPVYEQTVVYLEKYLDTQPSLLALTKDYLMISMEYMFPKVVDDPHLYAVSLIVKLMQMQNSKDESFIWSIRSNYEVDAIKKMIKQII